MRDTLDSLLYLNYILKDFKIVKTIDTQLLRAITSNNPNKELSVHTALDNMFCNVDLADSFNEKLIIIYDEVMYLEVLLGIHSWLTKKCCNIKNIALVVTHNIGVHAWYTHFLSLFGQTGFNLIEAPLLSLRYYSRFKSIKPYTRLERNNLKYYFSFYGGSYGNLERDFLSSAMIGTNAGYVDYMCGFSSTTTDFNNYLEQLTMFMDRAAVDKLLSISTNTQFADDQTKTFNENFSNIGFQYTIDSQSPCQVIRETVNNIPFSTITEKTLRSFLHQQIPIPLGVRNVESLQGLGFQMDYNIIDYNYQYESNFYKRISRVCDQLKMLKSTCTLDDLADYLNDKRDLIAYNYNYIHSEELYKRIKQNLLEKLNVH